MAVNKIYLTIDDCPSIHMDKKVSFLKHVNIPALFYARGEDINTYPDQIINVIKNGFLIGNHSYTHPYFSQISLDQCFDEILKTEKLIDECYNAAKVRRPHKVIRLPFADRGAGPKAAIWQNETDKSKVREIQNFMQSHNFRQVVFCESNNQFIDSFWDWDTEDYKKKHIENTTLYVDNMRKFFKTYPKDTAVILLHDFNNNHHLFEASMEFLIDNKVKFLDCQINEKI